MAADVTVDAAELERAIQERRYRILFAVEAAALTLTVVLLCTGSFLERGSPGRDAVGIMFGPLFMVHIVGIPCCVSYLIGRPILLSFELDGPTPAGRLLIAELEKQPVLSDEEFYERFYENRGVPRRLIDGVRAVLRSIEPDCDRATPDFLLGCLLYDLDYADIYYRLAMEFSVDRIDISTTHDGSIGMMIEDVRRRVSGHNPPASATNDCNPDVAGNETES